MPELRRAQHASASPSCPRRAQWCCRGRPERGLGWGPLAPSATLPLPLTLETTLSDGSVYVASDSSDGPPKPAASTAPTTSRPYVLSCANHRLFVRDVTQVVPSLNQTLSPPPTLSNFHSSRVIGQSGSFCVEGQRQRAQEYAVLPGFFEDPCCVFPPPLHHSGSNFWGRPVILALKF